MNAMQTAPQTTAPISYWRTLHDRLLADPALRRAAKKIDPGAFSLASTSKRRDDAIWQAHVGSAQHG